MVISLLSVYSSVSLLAYQVRGGDTTYFLMKHSFILAICLVLMFVFHRIEYKLLYKLARVLLFTSLPFLVLTFFVDDTRAAERWLEIPGIGLSFQPSDFAKFALIVFVAKVLSQNQLEIENFKKVLLRILIISGITCTLILVTNFSTAALLFTYIFAMLFVGRIPMKQIGLLTLVLAFMVFLMLTLIMNFPGIFPRGETWKNRLHGKYPALVQTLDFVNDNDRASVGNNTNEPDNYQALQAKIAVANGGLIGKGPGNSTQRDMLPQAYCDFIYAILIEEYGLIGGVIVMFLYLWLLFRVGLLVRKNEYTFPALLSFGLTFMIVFQALINMAVSVNLFPVTGQTMPLISMGGTSMFFTSISFGIILSISRSLEEEEERKKAQKKEDASDPEKMEEEIIVDDTDDSFDNDTLIENDTGVNNDVSNVRVG